MGGASRISWGVEVENSVFVLRLTAGSSHVSTSRLRDARSQTWDELDEVQEEAGGERKR